MASGRGGRGMLGGRSGGRVFGAKPESVKQFSEDATLPEKVSVLSEDKYLIKANTEFRRYWRLSPCYIEATSEKSQSVDIERYFDKEKPKRHRRRDNLESLLKISSFPIELQDVLLGKRGSKQRAPKKARSIVGKGLDKLDMLDKFEQEGQNKDDSEKPKKEEDEEDVEEEGEDAEYSDDGDYNQNEYFDDDEDD